MWQELVDAAPQFSRGIGTTLLYTALGAVSAFVISFVFGLMALSPSIWVRGISRTIVEFFRGTSLVVQLLWFAFVLPQLNLGFRLEPIAAATLALALNFGAYGSEVVRGAIVSVPKAQWEATVALSLSPLKRMRRVILPQAFPEMIPPFGNLLVQLLKSSSLLFLIGITDLTFEVGQLRSDLGVQHRPGGLLHPRAGADRADAHVGASCFRKGRPGAHVRPAGRSRHLDCGAGGRGSRGRCGRREG
jgi:polar amino acid transport system permease protein